MAKIYVHSEPWFLHPYAQPMKEGVLRPQTEYLGEVELDLLTILRERETLTFVEKLLEILYPKDQSKPQAYARIWREIE